MGDLSETSTAYRDDAAIYDLFSQREDADGVVLKHLLSLAKGLRVFDAGCGSGKYTAALASVALSVDAQDASPRQMEICAARCKAFKNIHLHVGDLAETVPAGPFDLILASWVLGTILDESRRQDILKRLESLLAVGGCIVLVENDEGGLFEWLRGRENDPLQRTARYNAWLKAAGFKTTLQATTRFIFENLAEARNVFACIWGEDVAAAILTSTIPHRVMILERRQTI